ncbi:hypothetical protein RYX36_031736 [Vicia faba]
MLTNGDFTMMKCDIKSQAKGKDPANLELCCGTEKSRKKRSHNLPRQWILWSYEYDEAESRENLEGGNYSSVVLIQGPVFDLCWAGFMRSGLQQSIFLIRRSESCSVISSSLSF